MKSCKFSQCVCVFFFLSFIKSLWKWLLPFPISWACYHCYQDVQTYEQLAWKIINKNVSGALLPAQPFRCTSMEAISPPTAVQRSDCSWQTQATLRTDHVFAERTCLCQCDSSDSDYSLNLAAIIFFSFFTPASLPSPPPPRLLWKSAVDSQKECLSEIVGHHVK